MTDRFNQILLLLMLAWAPLAFFVRSSDGFTLTKELVGLLVVVYFALLSLMKGTSIYRQPLVITALAFVLWMVGDSYGVSLVKPLVAEGSVHLWLILGTLIAVVFACSKGVLYEKLLNWAVAVGALMSLYGFFQVLGMDHYDWNTHFEARAFGTLGNPDYLGGYLVTLLPLAFVLTMRTYGQMPFGKKIKAVPATKSQKNWFVLRAFTLLIFVGLLLSRVKGSFVALAIATVFIAVAFLFPVGKELFRLNRRYALISLAVLVVGAGTYVYRHGGLEVFNPKQISVEQRVENYQVALAITKDHPLTGVGLGQIGVQYPRYQAAAYASTDYSQHPFTYSEHVHNDFLQFWVEGGLVGLALFLVLLLVYSFNLFQVFKDPQTAQDKKELLLGVAAGMVGLLGQSFSNFPLQVAPTAILFGLFLAAPLALRSVSSAGSSFQLSKLQQAILALGLLVTLGLGTRTMAATIAMRDTLGETNAGKSEQALKYSDRLMTLSPQDPKAWNARGGALVLAKKFDEAYDAYQKSLDLNPNYVEDLAQMANIRVQQGRFAEGLELSDKALAMTPNYFGPVWTKAVCLFQLKRYQDSAANFENFLAYSPNDAQTLLNVGVCYIQLHRKADAVAAWKKSYQLDPGNPQTAVYLKSQGVVLPKS